MAVGFITVLQLVSESVRSVDFSDQYLKAVSLANKKMGELELANFDAADFSGNFDEEGNYRWELALEPYDSPLNNEKENIRLMKVNLKVFWADSTQERNIALDTVKIIGKTFPMGDLALLNPNTGGVGKEEKAGGGSQAPKAPEPAPASSTPTDVSGTGSISPTSNISGAGSGSPGQSSGSSTASTSSSKTANISGGSSSGSNICGSTSTSQNVSGS